MVPPVTQETPDVRPLSKEYEELREELLREVASQPQSTDSPQNVIETHYVIQPRSPLPELDTTLAKAFVVQDTRDATRPLYGLVCSTKMPLRGNVVKALLGSSVSGMVSLHAAGLTEISGMTGRRMVLVYDRPSGVSLQSIINDRHAPFTEQFVVEYVVPVVGSVIQSLAERGVCHGRINPANIFFGKSVMVGECIAEPCGYSQHYAFETTERAQALPSGKGESMPPNDVYAMGMLAAYLRVGPRLFERFSTQEQHILHMLQHGSYLGVSAHVDFSDAMTDLLRGTLNDRPQERWTWQHIKPWCDGRRYNMLPPSEPGNAMRAMVMDKVEYTNLTMLSHGLGMHWDNAIRLLADGSLIRWVELSVRRKDVAELLRRSMVSLGFGAQVGATTARSMQQNDELISRTITILDSRAPLSRKDVRAHVNGMGVVMAEGYRIGAMHYVQHTLEMIEQGMPVVWADMYRRKDEEPPGDVTNMLWLLERMRVMLRINGFGFGVERALYDLNPDLPCQSPLLEDFHAATLRELLLALDRVAPAKAREEMPFDRHIAGFIGAKLNLSRESHLSEYNSIPKFMKHKAFVALRMLEQAQESAGRPRTPALTAWLSVSLVGAVELFHSKGVRRQLQVGIRQLADNGLFSPLSSFINQRGFALSDLDGFRDAIQGYFEMTQEIVKLRNKREQKRRASISGWAVAKYISHVALLIVTALVFRDYWR